MSLLTKLKESVLGLQGTTPNVREGAKNTSTLHNLSSLNDNPDILAKPSELDLDGKTPSKYMDNPPK